MSNTVGTDSGFISDIRDALQTAEKNRQDFMVVPLFHPRFRRDSSNVSCKRIGPGTRSDRMLDSKDWISNVVGKVSEWIDLDNPCQSIRKAGEQALKQEIMWASHLGLQAVILPQPGIDSVNYAKSIQQLISSTMYQHFWLTIPIIQGLNFHNFLPDLPLPPPPPPPHEDNLKLNHNLYSNGNKLDISKSQSDKQTDGDGWTIWNSFRYLCGHSSRLYIALEISEDLPDCLDSLSRWRSEPVRAIILSTKLFLTNKTGYPVLSKRHQQLVCMFLEYRVQVIIRGRSRHNDGISAYILYIRHLQTRQVHQPYGNGSGANPESGGGDRLTQAYRDYLQAPLQPLMDNLESQTYEVFERDPVKYNRYEEAITIALQDLLQSRSQDGIKEVENEGMMLVEDLSSASPLSQTLPRKDSASTPASPSSGKIIIAVVGAGRGPLVKCALSASVRAGVAVHIYAIEKNDNAVITLRNRCVSERWDNVTVIATDMRAWRPAELADILVSELLGSWGDNELSPECLDGAQICLKTGGVSIPTSYTSYLAPISSSRLWTNARELLDGKGLDTPYVVKLHNCYQIDHAQPLFTFTHPQPVEAFPVDNTRYNKLSFHATQDATIHGFAGTFFSCLYKDVNISIEPKTHSPNMFSWFPLFIPLCHPVFVHRGDTVTAHVWRCKDDRKVWYEWCLSSPVCTPVQNSNGRCYWIGL